PSASPLYTAPVGPPPAELSTTITAERGLGSPGRTNGGAFQARMVPSSASKMKSDGPKLPPAGLGIRNAPAPTKKLATIPVGVPPTGLVGAGMITIGRPGNATASAKYRAEKPALFSLIQNGLAPGKNAR